MEDYESVRTKRLRNDLKLMQELKNQSSIFDFVAFGDPPEKYQVTFMGKSFAREQGTDNIKIIETHRVDIELGMDYPRESPRLRWLTPIYHPNIAESGAVCLGGYSTNWVSSLTLDRLCEMLWDMIRYANYDPNSPYNWRAAQWIRVQTQYSLPLDNRPLRDRVRDVQGANVIKISIEGTQKSTSETPKKVETVREPANLQQPKKTVQPSGTTRGPGIKFVDDSGNKKPGSGQKKPGDKKGIRFL